MSERRIKIIFKKRIDKNNKENIWRKYIFD